LGRHLSSFLTFGDGSRGEESSKERKEEQEQLAAAKRIATLGSWKRDLNRDKLYWSEETRRIFGLSPDEDVTYERFMEAVHPEDPSRLRRQQEASEIERLALTKNTSRPWNGRWTE